MQEKDIQKRELEVIYSEAYFARFLTAIPISVLINFPILFHIARTMMYWPTSTLLEGVQLVRTILTINEEREIIAEYKSLDELVTAGWRLD